MTSRSSSPALTHIVLGVIVRDRQVLVAWRDRRLHQGGRWEFPGGKVEPGETPRQALQRELQEELGAAGTVGEPLIRFRHDYGDRVLLLDAYRAQIDRLESFAKHHRVIRWRSIQDLCAEEFPPANRSILNALRLPEFYAITPPELPSSARFADGRFEAWFGRLSETGVRLALFRAKGIAADAYRRLARRAVECAGKAGLELLLHDLPESVESLGAAGVHLSQSGFSRWGSRKRTGSSRSWFAVSCHDLGELHAAEEAGADFCVLGPVRSTPDHACSLGAAAFEQLVDQARIPVYALGGMRREDLAWVRGFGTQGVAGIRCFNAGASAVLPGEARHA